MFLYFYRFPVIYIYIHTYYTYNPIIQIYFYTLQIPSQTWHPVWFPPPVPSVPGAQALREHPRGPRPAGQGHLAERDHGLGKGTSAMGKMGKCRCCGHGDQLEVVISGYKWL